MSELMIEDLEVKVGKKINLNGIIVKEALKLMYNRKQFTIEGYDEVIELPEFMLTCFEIATELNQKRKRD